MPPGCSPFAKSNSSKRKNRLQAGVQEAAVRGEIRTMIKNLNSAIRRLEGEIRDVLLSDPEL